MKLKEKKETKKISLTWQERDKSWTRLQRLFNQVCSNQNNLWETYIKRHIVSFVYSIRHKATLTHFFLPAVFIETEITLVITKEKYTYFKEANRKRTSYLVIAIKDKAIKQKIRYMSLWEYIVNVRSFWRKQIQRSGDVLICGRVFVDEFSWTRFLVDNLWTPYMWTNKLVDKRSVDNMILSNVIENNCLLCLSKKKMRIVY